MTNPPLDTRSFSKLGCPIEIIVGTTEDNYPGLNAKRGGGIEFSNSLHRRFKSAYTTFRKVFPALTTVIACTIFGSADVQRFNPLLLVSSGRSYRWPP